MFSGRIAVVDAAIDVDVFGERSRVEASIDIDRVTSISEFGAREKVSSVEIFKLFEYMNYR